METQKTVDDLLEEEVDTSMKKKRIEMKEKNDKEINNKLESRTPYAVKREQQRKEFQERLKEEKNKQKLKQENKNKEEIVVIEKNKEANAVFTVMEKKNSCLIIVDNDDDVIEKEKKPDTKFLVNCTDDKLYDANASLQDNFKSFLHKRKNQKIRAKEDILRSCKVLNHDEEFRQVLRKKFIDQAFKYLGVPYAKKFYKEGDKYYDSPLFLDCCALVRKCVNDLYEDFKFSLFGWNQQYQYDILPDEIEFSQMQPGDLVFYSATFYDPKIWKPQYHDLVHVEIFLGGETGEQTIAAREPRGVVEVFDTYKFESSNYHSIIYRFKSIDTWLKGIHRSFCNEHKWHEEINTNNKFSLFNTLEEAEPEQTFINDKSKSNEIEFKDSIGNNQDKDLK